MKPREPRRRALVQGRIRLGASWRDVSILNISSRGLLLHASQPPTRGTYVEVRRGRHAIIARVIWSDSNRFGVHTQDRLSIDDLIKETTPAVHGDSNPSLDAAPFAERRASRRKQHSLSETFAHSRLRSRLSEFICIAIFGALLASMAFVVVGETLAAPLTKVLTALEPR